MLLSFDINLRALCVGGSTKSIIETKICQEPLQMLSTLIFHLREDIADSSSVAGGRGVRRRRYFINHYFELCIVNGGPPALVIPENPSNAVVSHYVNKLIVAQDTAALNAIGSLVERLVNLERIKNLLTPEEYAHKKAQKQWYHVGDHPDLYNHVFYHLQITMSLRIHV